MQTEINLKGVRVVVPRSIRKSVLCKQPGYEYGRDQILGIFPSGYGGLRLYRWVETQWLDASLKDITDPIFLEWVENEGKAGVTE